MTAPHTPESDRALIERLLNALKNTDQHSMYAAEVAAATARLAASEGDCPDALSEIADEIEATYPTADASNLRKLGKTTPPTEAAKVGDLPALPEDVAEEIVEGLWDRDIDRAEAMRRVRAAIAALRQPSDKLTDEQAAQHVVDLVGPLCDRGTFEAPDWAIACLHAAVNWDKPERIGKLATTPSQPSPSADVRQRADAYDPNELLRCAMGLMLAGAKASGQQTGDLLLIDRIEQHLRESALAQPQQAGGQAVTPFYMVATGDAWVDITREQYDYWLAHRPDGVRKLYLAAPTLPDVSGVDVERVFEQTDFALQAAGLGPADWTALREALRTASAAIFGPDMPATIEQRAVALAREE